MTEQRTGITAKSDYIKTIYSLDERANFGGFVGGRVLDSTGKRILIDTIAHRGVRCRRERVVCEEVAILGWAVDSTLSSSRLGRSSRCRRAVVFRGKSLKVSRRLYTAGQLGYVDDCSRLTIPAESHHTVAIAGREV